MMFIRNLLMTIISHTKINMIKVCEINTSPELANK